MTLHLRLFNSFPTGVHAFITSGKNKKSFEEVEFFCSTHHSCQTEPERNPDAVRGLNRNSLCLRCT